MLLGIFLFVCYNGFKYFPLYFINKFWRIFYLPDFFPQPIYSYFCTVLLESEKKTSFVGKIAFVKLINWPQIRAKNLAFILPFFNARAISRFSLLIRFDGILIHGMPLREFVEMTYPMYVIEFDGVFCLAYYHHGDTNL